MLYIKKGWGATRFNITGIINIINNIFPYLKNISKYVLSINFEISFCS